MSGKGDSSDLPIWIESQLRGAGLDPKRVMEWEIVQQPFKEGDEAIRVDINVKIMPEVPEEIQLAVSLDPMNPEVIEELKGMAKERETEF